MNSRIKNHDELKAKILLLEKSKAEQEKLLLAELHKTIKVVSDPAPFFKNIASELASDKDFRKDLLTLGLNVGLNYLGRLAQSPDTRSNLMNMVTGFLSKKTKSGGTLHKILEVLSQLRTTH